MPWTAADADAVRDAIRKMALGERAVSVSFAGPPQRSVSYQIVEMDKLRALLAEITREVGGGAAYRLASTNKGLGGVGGLGRRGRR